MAILLALIAVLLVPVRGLAQTQPDYDGLFTAGRHQDVVASVSADSSPVPDSVYLAAQSYERLNQVDQAREAYGKLSARAEDDAWKHIGDSGRMLLDGDADGAQASASRAVELASSLPEAHYQLGITYGHKQDYRSAAAAFDNAVSLDPGYAYAHYYAGLSYYRVKRIDLMATHFEAFLKLAPEAPERGEVESIMRTVRGR